MIMGNNTSTLELPILGTTTICPTGTDTSKVREIVMQGREMKILPSSVWNNFPWEEVRMLMHETATYVLPTEELISFLDDIIGDKSTIEICAGNGFIGRELNIPMTDSYQQQDDLETVLYYKMNGQPTIKYPKDVIKMEASKAVSRYNPHTVLGCYATHKWRYDTMSGNDKGVDFNWIYRRVKRIILVGNKNTHKDNPLMDIPHEEIILPGLITRSSDPASNRIFIWEN